MTSFFVFRFSFLVSRFSFLVIGALHIGSPEIFYQGDAGAYALSVRVVPPQVVPGLAQVSVRVRGGAERVTVAPGHSETGTEGQPPADVAVADANDPELFTTTVWIMARGAYRLVIDVDGRQGKGTAVVPVTAQATTRLPMAGPIVWVLLGAAAFLFLGLVSIVGAAARESVLPPGAAVTPERERLARRAMVLGALVIGAVLLGGWSWWRRVDLGHKAQLDRPWHVEAVVNTTGELRFTIQDSIWVSRDQPGSRSRPNPIIADHGKIMHMFLIRDDQQAFAHVHPRTTDQENFIVALPALPAGHYRVFADVVHQSGYTQTMTTTVDVPAITQSLSSDPDDSRWLRSDAAGALRWSLPDTVRAGQQIEIAVEASAPLEPYMGMPGHAVVARDDGSVFIHLHPLGTISLAAQQQVASKAGGVLPSHAQASGSRVGFPYAFPKPGNYRVWVQVRSAGTLITEAHDVVVTDP